MYANTVYDIGTTHNHVYVYTYLVKASICAGRSLLLVKIESVMNVAQLPPATKL